MLRLFAVPALSDNYIWLAADNDGMALVVDPGETAPVDTFLRVHGLTLRYILLTHHHPDHIGGSAALATRHAARILAPHDERITHVDEHVQDGDVLTLTSPDWQFSVLAVSGHTLSHVAYFGEGLLFSGDTLFSLGCGRLFEGTPAQMLASLDRLSVLPGDTQLCCGHEYTLANAAFAITLDAGNRALEQRMHEARCMRADNQPSLPSTLDSERLTNPFLRVDAAAIRAWADQHGVQDGRVQRFAALRNAKDHFRA